MISIEQPEKSLKTKNVCYMFPVTQLCFTFLGVWNNSEEFMYRVIQFFSYEFLTDLSDVEVDFYARMIW